MFVLKMCRLLTKAGSSHIFGFFSKVSNVYGKRHKQTVFVF